MTRYDWAKARPYLFDLFAAVVGLLGAIGTGKTLFAVDATGDAGWLHGLFLGCTALMLLGTIRFFVRTMDFPEPEFIPKHPAASLTTTTNADTGRHEAGGAAE